ncbi:hypothetical protein ACM46_10055 [Chryseobacterium angstadtii]|uniref:Uncharacterized protein n=1 Tax=Chryseobacterium angstadtii TaxID=558151 RepID=A0A0J7L6A1_9FLAO|nr:hypothetical protein [Chryseobacterium angstadtii]KMQ64590.1 hypothetical protein ACM46_10055 [Chryseobacterium angstadtii]
MNTITNHIKYFSKLSGVFILSLLKIYGIGILSTVIVLVLGIYILSNSFGSSLGHSGAYLFIVAAITVKPVSASLFFLLMIAAPFVIGIFATKYAMANIISRLVKDHSETLLVPAIDKIMSKFRSGQPAVVRTSADYALVKIKLLNEFKNSSENKILKKILSYALKKLSFDELDLKNGNANFYDIIKTKLIEKLHELAEPSAMIFYIYIGLQWLSLGLMYFLKV